MKGWFPGARLLVEVRGVRRALERIATIAEEQQLQTMRSGKRTFYSLQRPGKPPGEDEVLVLGQSDADYHAIYMEELERLKRGGDEDEG